MAKLAERDNSNDKEAIKQRARERADALREKVTLLETDLATIGFSEAEIKAMKKKARVGEGSFEIGEDTQARLAGEKEAKALR